ncbi:polymer-forming cytoskeletal protein [Patescibacteria group bacterium]|nr:polymer-forming cytoskeletal protein [Patescibacteria group bacterium]MBU4512052.1 polymer-forming cytoskeletal protein [Patescibacteria group bacterium]MCG2693237.1 polymer-forming cytoskeletal protein [Candidatus Parcubacteria bacterium]
MFKKHDDNQIPSNLEETQTIIGPGVGVKGDFEGEGDVIVEGKLEGSLKTKNNLRIGPGAKVSADLEADNVYIAGKVQGNIKAENEVELAESARIDGNITTHSLLVGRGASFNGQCSMVEDAGSGINNDKKKKEKKKTKEEMNDDEIQKIEVAETE